jgi:hypothetical protein
VTITRMEEEDDPATADVEGLRSFIESWPDPVVAALDVRELQVDRRAPLEA